MGLGAIGRPMAARLASRFPLTVWNRTAAIAEAFGRQVPCRVAPSAGDAVAEADVVVTCLSTSADVDQLLNGPTGIASALRPGSLFLDCTSGDAATSTRLASQLATRGIDFADCPVSGGTNGAEAGVLTVMVGGTAETFAKARPVLEAFGKLIVHVGPAGAGDTVKAVNQVLLASNILSLAEALTAMVKAGVPARVGLEVLNASSGRSFVSETLIPTRVLNGTWPKTFRLALMDKDVGIAVDLVHQLGLEAPLLDQVRERTATMRRALGEEADYLEPIKWHENQSGAEVRG
ncbi:MAG: NAD(P)-dependent oxidoreductase [Gemmatimonadales bacterium]